MVWPNSRIHPDGESLPCLRAEKVSVLFLNGRLQQHTLYSIPSNKCRILAPSCTNGIAHERTITLLFVSCVRSSPFTHYEGRSLRVEGNLPDLSVFLASSKNFGHNMEGRKGLAVVTGGGTGLGQAIALGLAALGIGVLVVGRRQEKLDETRAHFPSLISTVAADVTTNEGREAIVKAIPHGTKVRYLNLILEC